MVLCLAMERWPGLGCALLAGVGLGMGAVLKCRYARPRLRSALRYGGQAPAEQANSRPSACAAHPPLATSLRRAGLRLLTGKNYQSPPPQRKLFHASTRKSVPTPREAIAPRQVPSCPGPQTETRPIATNCYSAY